MAPFPTYVISGQRDHRRALSVKKTDRGSRVSLFVFLYLSSVTDGVTDVFLLFRMHRMGQTNT